MPPTPPVPVAVPTPGTDLVATVHQLLFGPGSEHPAPPTVLRFPSDTDPAELVELRTALGRWAGCPRSLALDRFVDPTLTEALGLPLLEPFGEELVELAGWGHWARWVGLGRILVGDATHPVVVLVSRPDPATGRLPEGSSWAERLRALTGWEPVDRPAVDWAAAEVALGTALPADYKEIVGLFGPGRFDEYISLYMPRELNRPARGLLQWAGSEQEIDFAWDTGPADPDDWPVLARSDFTDDWERYDCGMAEFLARLLTDVGFGFAPSYDSAAQLAA